LALAAKYDFAREISAESAENSRFRAGSYYFLLPKDHSPYFRKIKGAACAFFGRNIMNIWDTLYEKALEVQNGRIISPFVDAGGVAAAILSKSGNVYVGVCIDTACSLGMCAERNAIANMITNGESEIDKVVAVMSDGGVGSPCGACRELMMQLSSESYKIEILTDKEAKTTVTLGELMPDWWGRARFDE
jgi:homotetrameric cytidine deaminase